MRVRNSFLELMRFVFCIVIFLHHSGFLVAGDEKYPFKAAGFFAVEFFFILTGALSLKHAREKINRDSDMKNGVMKYSMSYTISKLKRVFPYALTGIVLTYIWYFVQADYSNGIKDVVFGRWNIIYEILFLPMSGVMDVNLNSFLNSPLWYLSVLLLVLPLVMYIAIKFEDVFDNYLCWILPLVLHGLLIKLYGNIGNWGEYTGIAYSAVFRGFADLLLGCAAYLLGVALYKKLTKLSVILTVAEIGMYLFAIYTFNTNVDGYTYEFSILILTVAVGISLSGTTYTSRLSGKFFEHLGKLSLPMYCLHWPIYKFVSEFDAGWGYSAGVLLALVMCICLSECLIYTIERTQRRLKVTK